MNAFTRALFRIGRWIAGRDRAEWLDAMAAEAEAIKGDSTAWALGCFWAAAKDRFARDWSFAVFVLLLPVVVSLWKLYVFFATSSLQFEQQIPDWLAVACWILSPFPFAVLVPLVRAGRSALIAVAIAFLAVEAVPVVMMLNLGVAPSQFFGPNFNWYKCDPGVRIGLVDGIAVDFAAWATAFWLGSALRRRFVRLRG